MNKYKQINIYIYICIYIYIYTYACTYVHMHLNINPYTTHAHTCRHACANIHAYTWMHLYVQAWYRWTRECKGRTYKQFIVSRNSSSRWLQGLPPLSTHYVYNWMCVHHLEFLLAHMLIRTVFLHAQSAFLSVGPASRPCTHVNS